MLLDVETAFLYIHGDSKEENYMQVLVGMTEVLADTLEKETVYLLSTF